jgi:hypothetical protein
MRRLNPDGNARLTAAVGVLLLVPIAVELATIVLGVHTFMSVHVFIGVALIPPILLKLGSTGWRFVRYYTRGSGYVEHGPPQLVMRLLAPLFVVATVVLFTSGVMMGLLHGHALDIARRLHGPSAAVWVMLLGVHVLVYLRRAVTDSSSDLHRATRRRVQGAGWRIYALATALVCGFVIAVASVPAQHHWIDIPSHQEHNGHSQ